MLRMVGQAASWRSGDELERLLPMPPKYQKPVVDMAKEFNTPEYKEWYAKMKLKNNLK